MDIYLPVIPKMPGILDTSTGMIQLTLTVYMIMLGVGQIAFGPLSDRVGRRPVLIGGALIFAAASFLLALVSSAPLFLALRFLQAVGASAALVALFATVRDVYAARPESTTVYGLMNAMLAFVPALGPIAGALIADTFGWRIIFAALGVMATAALLWVLPRWHETRPLGSGKNGAAFGPILKSTAFWVYTLAFSAAMGSFFVFFSTAPRVLIDGAGMSELSFSLAFATTAVVMIVTTRFAARAVDTWGIAGSATRGMLILLAGAALLAGGELWLAPSFWRFIPPMWLMSAGIVFAASVTANGALRAFGDVAGTAVALHFCVQSIIVGVVGTSFVIALDGSTAWPLAGYATTMGAATLGLLAWLRHRGEAGPAA
jgi:DHA1 family florfenicol/chloramphenicol resistance protein-like MFS transporter